MFEFQPQGELLRSILHPREPAESFVSDSLKFIALMGLICVGLFTWSATTMAAVGATPLRIGFKFLDMVTIAVPPALPACLTICTVFAIGRLRKKGIFVTGPERVALAGHLDMVCFDKTGALN